MMDAKKGFTVRVDPKTHKELKRLAIEKDMTLSSLMLEAIEEYLKSHPIHTPDKPQ